MLTRIYGTAFFDQAALDEYLERVEQARLRDHRRLGRELDLFHFSDVSPGSPFWHPRGMVIWNELTTLWRELNRERGYQEVRTPILYNVEVWKRSGHWEAYRENMYFTEVEAGEFGIKPMNCPGHVNIFGDERRSYRDCRCDWPSRGWCTARAVRHPARPDAGAAHHAGRRPHLLHPRADRGRGDRLPGAGAGDLRDLPARPPDRAVDRPEKRIGGDELWDAAEAALHGALERAGWSTS
jgi:threonyl-tRNA synthetase